MLVSAIKKGCRCADFQQYRYRQYRRISRGQYRRIGKNVVSAHPYYFDKSPVKIEKTQQQNCNLKLPNPNLIKMRAFNDLLSLIRTQVLVYMDDHYFCGCVYYFRVGISWRRLSMGIQYLSNYPRGFDTIWLTLHIKDLLYMMFDLTSVIFAQI